VDATQPKRPPTDWIAARDFWLALPHPRRLAAVAREYGISEARVRFIAKRDNWQGILADIEARALRRTSERIVRSRDERTKAMLALTDLTIETAFDHLTAGSLDVRLADIPGLVRTCELLLGEATDRVSFVELQEALGVVMAISVEAITGGWPVPAFLERVRERIGAIEAQVAA
jgi:hypothetical protein